MGYPFSIFGTIIYIIYLAIVLGVIVVPIYLLIKNKSWKWFVITPIAIVLITAPVAEELWIQYRFESLCKDAGIHVKKRVKAEGYMKDMDSVVSSKMLKESRKKEEKSDFEKQGFRFYESRLADGKVMHLERDGDFMVLSILDKPQARYYFKYSHNNSPVGWKLRKIQRVIIDSRSKESIGSETFIKRYPGWIEAMWAQFLGTGMQMCPDPEKQIKTMSFPKDVFILNKQQDVR